MTLTKKIIMIDYNEEVDNKYDVNIEDRKGVFFVIAIPASFTTIFLMFKKSRKK